MPNDETVNVRYMVDDVDASLAFYTSSSRLCRADECRARVRRRQARQPPPAPLRTDELRRPPDARRHQPEPGGWNRIHFIVDDLDAEVARLRDAGATFRNDIVDRARRQADPPPRSVRQHRGAVPTRRTLSPRPQDDEPVRAPDSAAGVAVDRRRAVGTHRLHRLRRSARPHRACCATSASTAAVGSAPTSSRTRSPRATCCPARRPRSSRSSRAWRVAGPAGAIVGGLAFIVPGLVLILASPRCSSRRRRRRGSSAPAREPEPRSPRSRCAPEPTSSGRASAARRRAALRWVALRVLGGARRRDARPVARARAARLRTASRSPVSTFGRGTGSPPASGRRSPLLDHGRHDRRPARRWSGSRSKSVRCRTAAGS